jgi:hypothetical protein
MESSIRLLDIRGLSNNLGNGDLYSCYAGGCGSIALKKETPSTVDAP